MFKEKCNLKLLVIIFFGIFPAIITAQTENLLDNINLHFSLGADPNPAAVGFDNPKSYWKTNFELYLTDSFELEKTGRCVRNELYQLVCGFSDKKTDKIVKKISKRLLKGSFERKGLIEEKSREIIVSLQFTPEIVKVFNDSVGKDNINPTFVLFVKTKVFAKTSTNAKLKEKFETNRVFPLKSYNPDKTFLDYWNVKDIGSGYTISQREDKKFVIMPQFY